jgi:hypothetical protein
MTLKGRVGLLGLMGVAVIVASVAAVVLFAGSTGAVSPSPVSNNGTPIDLSGISAQDKHALDSTGVDGNPRLLRVIHGRAFYRFSGKAGEDCYATGSSAQAPAQFGTVACPKGFPTEQPILDQSFFKFYPSGVVKPLALQGFAADRVARVAVVDAGGIAYSTPVVNNVYFFAELPDVAVTRLVAFDGSDRQIFSQDLGRN